jgi:hypothetical protein
VSSALTVQRTTYPPHLRALDRLVGALQAIGLPLGRLDQRSILDAARRRTGLNDYGDDAFLEAMELVLRHTEPLGFTALARLIVRETHVKAVSNRLRLQAQLARRPEILTTPVHRPIFVLGFPRSGTTLLQNLLAQAPSRRGLRFWELITPVPVHDDPTIDAQRRLTIAARILQASYLMAPEMRAVHEVRADTFEECWYLFMNSFAVLNQDFQTGAPAIGDWLFEHDMTGPYREYRRWLQMMLTMNPAEQLLLKCPEHLWFLDALLEVFPDACIVWTHRDPVASIASYASMMTLPRRTLFGRVDPHALGAHITERFLRGTERAMATRRHADPARFFDVQFHDLLRDPKRVVQELSEHFQLHNPPDYDARLDAYLSERRGDERGKHVYSAERYGIDPAEVHRRYAPYLEAFQIPVAKERA